MNKKYILRIGVLTDDLTGGGDVGVQFADKGLKVVLSIDVDSIKEVPEEAEVWIINTNTRNSPEAKAEKKVKKALKYLKEWRAEYYYKKIDSTLRGRLGSEMEEMIKDLDIDVLPFCAAFPEMGRRTKNSVHYVGNQKVSESSYGKDINNPVKESNIKKILDKQMKDSEKVDVKDASTNKDLEKLSEESSGKYFAGAAAWAGKLADRWLTTPRKVSDVIFSPGPVLVLSGSLNPVSLQQVNYWESQGLDSIEVSGKKKEINYDRNILIKTSTKKSHGIIKKINKFATSIWNSSGFDRVILNGGDTAFNFMRCIDMDNVNVIKSVMPGIALTEKSSHYFILKPGGYGKPDTLVKLAKIFSGK